MDQADEIRRLGAQNIALQTLVIGLMHELSGSGQGEIARGAFEKADQAMEIAILSLGDRASPEYARQAMESLEQLRRMAFPAESGPKA
ncbi:hypothetical protein [Croceicoccus bisphenolivorans]|uniref:hypothetical protein n=1 Tax=Croceicoccus bisphenolivorans TaxID=1783232 RepID=UPI000835589F|nr:hypothetical protein [Croceicoccus bisphenolivorans]